MRLTLETLSPLHIGCNESYSATTDYIYARDRRKAILISPDKMEAALRSRSRLPIDLVETLVNRLRGPGNFHLCRFLQDNKVSISEVALSELDAIGEVRGEIRRFIYGAGGAFVPGSSLKGAFRTALAFAYLKEHAPQTLADAVKNRLPRDRRQVKEAFKDSGLEGKIFLDPHRDPLKNIAISDSTPLRTNALKVYGVKRFYIAELARNSTDLRQGSPVSLECIPGGKTIQLLLGFGRFLPFKREFSFLRNSSGLSDLFGHINQFSLASVSREVSEFKQRNAQRLAPFIAFYEHLHTQIESLPANSCILRLGFGKTFWDETVDLLISNDQDAVKRLERYLNTNFWSRRARRACPGDPLPTTRYFVPDNQGDFREVLGWVKVSV
jgi:CRISPR-associated protein Csm5